MKKSRREGPWSEIPAVFMELAQKPACEMCGRKYGRIAVGPAGFLKVEEAIHHIFARRWVEARDWDAHQPANLISLCKTCHGKLLQPEECLWAGDVYSFIRGLKEKGFPMLRVQQAARLYRLQEVEKFFSHSELVLCSGM